MSDDGNPVEEPDDRDDLAAAEYVLGVLDAEARGDLARRAQAEPGLAARIEAWQSRLAPLDDGYQPSEPPAGTYRAIEQRLFGAAERRAGAGGWWDSLLVWRTLAASAAFVAVLAVAVSLLGPLDAGRPTAGSELVASLHAEDADTQLVALYDPDIGALHITPVSVTPRDDKDFELWLIEGGDDPISLGLVSQRDHHSIDVPQELQARFHPGAVLAITLEPLGGAPGGVATGPVVALGETTQI